MIIIIALTCINMLLSLVLYYNSSPHEVSLYVVCSHVPRAYILYGFLRLNKSVYANSIKNVYLITNDGVA